jgi:hypothetical protein
MVPSVIGLHYSNERQGGGRVVDLLRDNRSFQSTSTLTSFNDHRCLSTLAPSIYSRSIRQDSLPTRFHRSFSSEVEDETPTARKKETPGLPVHGLLIALDALFTVRPNTSLVGIDIHHPVTATVIIKVLPVNIPVGTDRAYQHRRP